MNPSEKKEAQISNQLLRELAGFLETTETASDFLNLNSFRDDLATGLYFQSNIPNQYGVGSSGALTAALYHRYSRGNDALTLPEIRQQMAVIESFYHGTSSGLDPLVSYVQKPVWIESSNRISTEAGWPGKFLAEYDVFLIDSGLQGGTGSLVNWFMEQHQRAAFRDVFDGELVKNINLIIEHLLSDPREDVRPVLRAISLFQLNHFRPMIPMGFRKHFRYGLESGDFTLKLCGSGGGGYLLGFTQSRAATENYFRDREINCLFLEMIPERVDEN
jgi:mevalonate kinase